MKRPPARIERIAWYLLAALALAAGVFVRAWQLDRQILLDDEWHAVNKLLRATDAHDIATHFGLADYSIPLTLFYRFLYQHGGLTDWGMRAPMLLAGIGLLLAAPAFTRTLLPLATRVLWVALMAISPLLTYHTRTARPYAITTFLCFVAIFAFRRWWLAAGNAQIESDSLDLDRQSRVARRRRSPTTSPRALSWRSISSRFYFRFERSRPRGERRWGWALLYLAATFLAGWLHLIALSFALAPFLYYGFVTLGDLAGAATRVAGWRRLRDLVVLGVATTLPLAAALLPPLINDAASLAAKTGTDTATLASFYRTLLICFGIASPWLLALAGVLAALGVRSLWRRERDLTRYLAFVVLVAVGAIAASKADWLQHQLNFARYMQPAVPFLLLALAEGTAFVLGVLPSLLRVPAAAAGLAALYLAGPMPGYLYSPNQFMGDAYFQFDYDPAYNPYLTSLPHGPIPEFYRELGRRPPRSLTLIEMPWSLETNHDPQPLYQAVHRQNIKIALTTPQCGVSDYGNWPESAAGMRLRRFVPLSALLRGETAGGDYLVVHFHPWPDPQAPPSFWPDLKLCLPQVEQHFGAPVYRDDEIEVFALSPAARASP